MLHYRENPLEDTKDSSLGAVGWEDVVLQWTERGAVVGLCAGPASCLTPLAVPQHSAHRQEGTLPQLPLHGLARDPLAGPETPYHPHTRKPRECVDLLLPIKPPGPLMT